MGSTHGTTGDNTKPLLVADEAGRSERPTQSFLRCRDTHGTLALRAADGFARNMVFANQIDLFQRFAGLDQNSAQQQAKFLSAACSSMPALIGLATKRWGWSLEAVVLTGCSFEALGIAALAAAAAGVASPGAVQLALFALYAAGYGALTSALPALGMREVAEDSKAAFSQCFFACLAGGGIVGILGAGAAQALDAYSEGFALALFVLLAGAAAFASRRRSEAGAAAATAAAAAPEAAGSRPRAWPLVVLVPFYAAYLQWTTSWYVQASAMDGSVLGLHAPPCLLQAMERLTALSMLVLLGWLWKDPRRSVAPAYRLAAGCAVAGLALAAAGAVEVARREAPRLPGRPEVSSLHSAWLLPQFCLIAVAETLVFPAQTQWAAGCPLLNGMVVAAQAAAATLLGLALPHLQVWVPATSINEGHYEYFFWSLAAGCFASATLFAALPASAWARGAADKV